MDTDAKKNYRRELGQRLRDARVASGVGTQADAAERLSAHLGETVEPSRIGNYEQGYRSPDAFTLRALCEIYEASPSYIYGFQDAPQNENEKKLLITYRMTDDRGKRLIQSVAESQPAYGAGMTQDSGEARNAS